MFNDVCQCRSGVLDGSLAARFAAVALWNLPLGSYPGTTSQICSLLAQQHRLTTVDVSLTHVCILSVTAVTPAVVLCPLLSPVYVVFTNEKVGKGVLALLYLLAAKKKEKVKQAPKRHVLLSSSV